MSDKIKSITDSAIAQIKDMVNAETIIGTPITTPGGVTIIPVSKVTYGFGSGGSDSTDKKHEEKTFFGGGCGAGVSIIPLAFLVINGEDVKLLQIESFTGSLDRIIAMAPDLVDKIGNAFKKRKDKKNGEEKDTIKTQRD